MLNKNYNRKALDELLRSKIFSASKNALQQIIEQLQIYRNAFNQLSAAMLGKNGFPENAVGLYRQRTGEVLQTAVQRYSMLLSAEQLPGQQALFSPGVNYAQARKAGNINIEGTDFKRQPRLLNIIKGRVCTIAFAMNVQENGFYCIMEAAELQPSHLGELQNPLHFIPEAQPRNRSASASGANTPRIIAQHLQPAQIIEGATAYTGAPIVNQFGEVIQGNGRAYTLKYYWQINPEDSAGYRKYISQVATCYGFPAGFKALEKYSQPCLVRMVTIADDAAIRLGQYVAKDLEAVATETTQTKSRVNLLTPAVAAKLVEKITANETPEATLSELIRASGALRVLIDGGVIRADEQEIYTRNGQINEAGVQLVQRLLMGLVFRGGDVNAPDVFAMLPVPLQRSIEKAVLHIVRLPASHAIGREVTEAVLLYRDYIAQGRPPINLFINQTSAFERPISERFSPLSVRLLEIFDTSKTQKELVQAFAKYSRLASGSAGDMFSDATEPIVRHKAIKEAFGAEVLNFEKQRLQALLKK